jgi:hypothetical protein
MPVMGSLRTLRFVKEKACPATVPLPVITWRSGEKTGAP